MVPSSSYSLFIKADTDENVLRLLCFLMNNVSNVGKKLLNTIHKLLPYSRPVLVPNLAVWRVKHINGFLCARPQTLYTVSIFLLVRFTRVNDIVKV